jgi:acyl carrier protein
MLNFFLEDELKNGLSNKKACEIFDAILAHPYGNSIASKRISLLTDEASVSSEIQITVEDNVQDMRSVVREIWLKVLGVESVDMDDCFYDLGGDSLAAIQLTYQLKLKLDLNISPDILLSKSKFKDFVKAIS